MKSTARFLALSLCSAFATLATPVRAETVESILAENLPLTPEAINSAPLVDVDTITTGSIAASQGGGMSAEPRSVAPSASIVRLQILLDRAGASPGVIDGRDGSNLRKAIAGFQAMQGWSANGQVGQDVVAALESTEQVIAIYQITAEDHAVVAGDIPTDYGELSRLNYLGYQTVEEGLAERFHMDVDLLRALNPESDFAEGLAIFVADFGQNRKGQVAKVEVDKPGGKVLAYAADGALIATYPATIGSEDNPSPIGTHTVKAIVKDPTYTYNPKVNFKQGNNDEVLTLQPGPNNPVGTVWIDLSEPTYGIHGTPEPGLIDKTGSHGCVRLTNWDARELSDMLSDGVTVAFHN